MTYLFQPIHLLLFLVGSVLLLLLLVLLLFAVLLKMKRPMAAPPDLDPQARLERLAALQQQNFITDAEYQAKRRQLLDEL